MVRTLARAALLLALTLGSGCPGSSRSPVSPGNRGGDVAPVGTTAPREPRPAGYEDVREGQVYEFTLFSGGRRKDRVVAVSPAELELVRTIELGGREETTLVREPIPPPEKKPLPGASVRTVGEEVLVVSGHDLPCTVRETAVAGQSTREWLSPRWPFVLKTVGNGFVLERLASIAEPAPAPPGER